MKHSKYARFKAASAKRRDRIRRLVRLGMKQILVARKFKITPARVNQIVNGK